MTSVTWFEIECVDGAAATLYVLQQLHGADLHEIRMALAALPRSVRVLRVQLHGAASDACRGARLFDALRAWREARGGSARVLMTRPAVRAEPTQALARALRAAPAY
jgi:hypothetical protein